MPPLRHLRIYGVHVILFLQLCHPKNITESIPVDHFGAIKSVIAIWSAILRKWAGPTRPSTHKAVGREPWTVWLWVTRHPRKHKTDQQHSQCFFSGTKSFTAMVTSVTSKGEAISSNVPKDLVFSGFCKTPGVSLAYIISKLEGDVTVLGVSSIWSILSCS